ncbi:MAG: RIP metalloprotease RseP [bacterium]|nr:RIP metalloprotease RseP [bacterium]
MLTLLVFLAVLSVLVLVHELGHFIAARRMGVTVEEFGFGFPPRIFGFKRGDTTYSINWIPLGGFVRLKGESGEDFHHHDSFIAKTIPRRALIIAAGVVMNFLLAAVLFSVGFMIGLPQQVEQVPASARVRDVSVAFNYVVPESPAARVGFQAGDVVLSIDGNTFQTAEATQEYIRSREGQTIHVVVRRQGETQEFDVIPEVLPQTGKPGIGVGLLSVGIVSYPWYMAPVRGVILTAGLTGEIAQAFINIFRSLVSEGRVGVDVSGPVGIAVLTGRAAALGFSYLLQFVAVLSLNLAVINFLPIPALDGGRFLFLMIEAVRRKPVSRQLENAIHQIGFALLLALVLVVTYRDVAQFSDRIIGGLRGLF